MMFHTMGRRGLARARAVVAVAGVALVLAACGTKSGDDSTPTVKPTFAPGSTMEKLSAAGKLRVGIKFDKPGFSERTLDGKYVGMDVSIAEMVATALGIPTSDIEFTEAVSANREPFLQQGKLDLVAASYSITPERQEVVTFAGPYSRTGDTVMVAKGNPLNIQTWDDLNGKTVCGVASASGLTETQDLAPQVKTVGFDTEAKCGTALINKQVDAVIASEGTASGLVAQSPDDFEVVKALVAGEENIGIGIPKGQVDFCQFIDDVLTANWESGQYQQAWADTLGKTTGQDPQALDFIPCS